MRFNTIPEALEDLRQGKIILVTDDPERENEGDFICAAEFATTENVNFMATHGKGLICMPMDDSYVEKLNLPQMCITNTDNHCTAFTVSVDVSLTCFFINADLAISFKASFSYCSITFSMLSFIIFSLFLSSKSAHLILFVLMVSKKSLIAE